MEEKAYCSECRYYKDATVGYEECLHPANKGNWHSRQAPGKDPYNININNDCKWYDGSCFGAEIN